MKGEGPSPARDAICHARVAVTPPPSRQGMHAPRTWQRARGAGRDGPTVLTAAGSSFPALVYSCSCACVCFATRSLSVLPFLARGLIPLVCCCRKGGGGRVGRAPTPTRDGRQSGRALTPPGPCAAGRRAERQRHGPTLPVCPSPRARAHRPCMPATRSRPFPGQAAMPACRRLAEYARPGGSSFFWGDRLCVRRGRAGSPAPAVPRLAAHTQARAPLTTALALSPVRCSYSSARTAPPPTATRGACGAGASHCRLQQPCPLQLSASYLARAPHSQPKP